MSTMPALSAEKPSVWRGKIASLLQSFQKGDTREYDLFLIWLKDKTIKSGELLDCLQQLRHCVIQLDKDHKILVGLLLTLNWLEREEEVVREYRSLLLNIFSAHPVYIPAGLRMLVINFMPKVDGFTKIVNKLVVDEATRKRHDLTFANVHVLLRSIIKIAPLMHKTLLPLLRDKFPHHTRDAYLQACYVKNLLQLLQYLPEDRSKVLGIIISNMLKQDTRAPRKEVVEAEAQEDKEEAMEQCPIFEMEESMEASRSVQDEVMTHGDAHKLDTMMEVFFAYIRDSCYENGELNWEATKRLYRELLLVFETYILPTHASCHVQFIMFYICSFKQGLFEGFIDYLWKQVQDPNTQAVFRQAAVAYIGSFLARANYIPFSTVKTSLDIMVNWIHSYHEQLSSEYVRADVVHHGPYYAVCQAVFYVFSFRNREIMESRKGYKWAEALNLSAIVTSRLNPLRVCPSLIVHTFASVTRQHQLAFCDTIIERNRRNFLPVASPSDNLGYNVNSQLDLFFPFDPYVLKRSGAFILPLYRNFQCTVQEEKQVDSEEDDFLQDMETMEMSAEAWAMSLSKSPGDLLHYGISPGFKHS